jgi:hypothetical protein
VRAKREALRFDERSVRDGVFRHDDAS